jgi:hypothetical protein
MEEVKFTQEELGAIASLQQKYASQTFKFGQLYLDKQALEGRLMQNSVEFDTAKRELEAIREEERKLADLFQKKYGDGQLNLETGVFTPTPKPPQQ